MELEMELEWDVLSELERELTAAGAEDPVVTLPLLPSVFVPLEDIEMNCRGLGAQRSDASGTQQLRSEQSRVEQ
jgi:hypothetical protein